MNIIEYKGYFIKKIPQKNYNRKVRYSVIENYNDTNKIKCLWYSIPLRAAKKYIDSLTDNNGNK